MLMKGTPGPDAGTTADNDKNLTPGMRQYREIKAQYPDAILFFHIGDFFETLEDDAIVVSRELDLVLTSRSKNGDQKIPLAGVPHHAGEGYIARLVAKGYKVAICEQLEDPKTAKGLVKRGVVRIITPGTVIDPVMLPSSAAAYLMALSPGEKGGDWGIALLDISTGEFFVLALPAEGAIDNICSEIARYRPAECIVPSFVDGTIRDMLIKNSVVVTPYADDRFLFDRAARTLMDHFGVSSLEGYGCGEMPAAVAAAGAALAYAEETQQSALPQVSSLATRTSSQGMMLDAVTLRNLEVHECIRAGSKGATLFRCSTGQKPRWGAGFYAASSPVPSRMFQRSMHGSMPLNISQRTRPCASRSRASLQNMRTLKGSRPGSRTGTPGPGTLWRLPIPLQRSRK
jgi:DNA mismatch repair protein MutS